jgi:L-ascorbate metabolism protein UlaG (beta-lactamase superfamily)
MAHDSRLYLKQNLVIEPLLNQWYAWPYLIAPATAAMFVNNSHIKLMQSFVSAPQVHAFALKNPEMIGGPFVNYDFNKVNDIKKLLEKTIKEQAHLIEFANAVKSLDENLSKTVSDSIEMRGYSLESLYKDIPIALRGYVELVYNLNNYPSIRFIEGLLYKSQYYNKASQSLALFLIDEENRPFVFSTPRLENNSRLHLNLPFEYEELDNFFKIKYEPQTIEFAAELLGVEKEDKPLFSSFFTNECPRTNHRYTGDKVRIRYFGHACILIETKNVNILTDPVISYNYQNGIPRYTYLDLPETIDYILITHNHQDHLLFESLLQLRYKIKNIIVPKNNNGFLADPSIKLLLKNTGFNNVIEIDEMETLQCEDCQINGIPFFGEHTDLNITTKLAYLINTDNKFIMIAADSNNIEPNLYKHINKIFGDIEILFLGMECDGAPLSWLYGPLQSKPLSRKMDQSRRLNGSNYESAISIVEALKPRQAYVYAMGQEPWLTFLTSIKYTEKSRPIIDSNKFVEECINRGIISERLYGQKEFIL